MKKIIVALLCATAMMFSFGCKKDEKIAPKKLEGGTVKDLSPVPKIPLRK